ncbi:acyl-CoA desaturase [Acanthopleuribacter pedis]|uniref:Acyl-CoA desaturase n=1 Tax=Acanthopleuribacter pedis TaxID=442870 RepID=A0A8J7QCA6_9BACT|nr:acyl-CoA desaturase [Acanthopleuribacter pedis]MBO1321124.1 acyl-CoA desaturase [Acanthopleuribacter pedis]
MGFEFLKKIAVMVLLWFDTDYQAAELKTEGPAAERFNWVRVLPFIGMHLACLTVFLVGWSWFAVLFALGMYLIRMFAITAFYHRYFSHRSFKSSRVLQFFFALLGCSAVQRGPLWWAAHHRHHHAYSDTERDAHSPTTRGFWWSHMFWFTCDANFPTQYKRVKDFAKFPELVFLNRYDILVPFLLAVGILALGKGLEVWAPGLGVTGWQLLVWGFVISTVVLFHATFTINSLAHVIGSRRFETKDDSRNNWWLALLTLGEGWHNNHHRYPASVRQGFRWWEIDVTYYVLRLMAVVGLIWDLRPVPERILQEASAAGKQPAPA